MLSVWRTSHLLDRWCCCTVCNITNEVAPAPDQTIGMSLRDFPIIHSQDLSISREARKSLTMDSIVRGLACPSDCFFTYKNVQVTKAWDKRHINNILLATSRRKELAKKQAMQWMIGLSETEKQWKKNHQFIAHQPI